MADPQPASDPTPPAPTEAAPIGPVAGEPAEQVATGEVRGLSLPVLGIEGGGGWGYCP